MSGWNTSPIAWNCVSCQAFIPAGEPFYRGKAETTLKTCPVCLSCILTAAASLLPGQPKSIRVEWIGASSHESRTRKMGRGEIDMAVLVGQEYRLTVDGVEYGVMTVDAGIAEDQHVPALLALVRQALKWREAAVQLDRARQKAVANFNNELLAGLPFVPAEPGPYRYQPREPLPGSITAEVPIIYGRPDLKITAEVTGVPPSFTVGDQGKVACRHLGGEEAAQRGGVLLCLKPGCAGRHAREVRCLRCGEWVKYHALTAWRGRLRRHPAAAVEDHPERPSDACSCLRPIFGRWHDIPSDRLAPYGLNKKWSALKGCKTCGGTGRVPPPRPATYPPPGLGGVMAQLHARLDAGLPIFIKNDPDVVRDPQFFSGQGVVGPQVKRAADEIRAQYLAWVRQQGARLSRNLFAAYKAGRESAR
jgi:hypothetical protein